MTATTMQLEVLTPESQALSALAESVYLEGEFGRLGILPQHANFISKLRFGTLEYQGDDGKHKILCGTGILEVKDNVVTVLARSAESLNDIDVGRAKSALERAKSRLHSKDNDVDMIRAEAALFRAINRLKFTNKM